MSRLGKLSIKVPPGVTVMLAANLATVKGPKGELTQALPRQVSVESGPDQLVVKLVHPDKAEDKAYWGLARQLLANSVRGVSEGFTKQLEIHGVGFRAAVEGTKLVLNVGYSHPVNFSLPAGITVQVAKNVITIQGVVKQQVGEVAAQIRAIKPPEPYKGKGIKYVNEVVRRKAGKLAKTAGVGAK